jgi:hypothetical protein
MACACDTAAWDTAATSSTSCSRSTGRPFIEACSLAKAAQDFLVSTSLKLIASAGFTFSLSFPLLFFPYFSTRSRESPQRRQRSQREERPIFWLLDGSSFYDFSYGC